MTRRKICLWAIRMFTYVESGSLLDHQSWFRKWHFEGVWHSCYPLESHVRGCDVQFWPLPCGCIQGGKVEILAIQSHVPDLALHLFPQISLKEVVHFTPLARLRVHQPALCQNRGVPCSDLKFLRPVRRPSGGDPPDV